MAPQLGRYARHLVCLFALLVVAACSGPQPSGAAPFAAIVQDARSGEVLFSENADTRLHPASLTKMMTLYIAFQEIERGNLSLDTIVTVSKSAASQPPSRLGLKSGQKIALRYLIRAAAIKSANDAAAAIGDHISGDRKAFAVRMTKTAHALGMTNSTFKNANGLTEAGHLSTARDMNLLGRRLFYDFPQYYNIFSRRTTDAGMATVRNTNTRFLDAYEGADGIKTGYTVAAGFNLTASAQRGNKRIIATVFGGTSTAMRNSKMAELMNLGFRKAPDGAAIQPPPAVAYQADIENAVVAAVEIDDDNEEENAPGSAAKTIRLQTAVLTSPRPLRRPSAAAQGVAEQAVADISTGIDAALAEAIGVDVAETDAPADSLDAQAVALAEVVTEATAVSAARPAARPEAARADIPFAVIAEAEVTPPTQDIGETEVALAKPETELAAESQVALAEPAIILETPKVAEEEPVELALVETADPEDLGLSEPIQLAAAAPIAVHAPSRAAPIFDSAKKVRVAEPTGDEPVVIRISTSNARHFGVNLGKFNTRGEAERILLRTQLGETATLGEGLRKVVQKGGGYQAQFMGLTEEQADMACRRLQARAVACETVAP